QYSQGKIGPRHTFAGTARSSSPNINEASSNRFTNRRNDMDYNKTINLPKTDFPMRAGLPKREPEMLERWRKIAVYRTLLKKNEGKPRLSLHDGPPFSNGARHMGHALNKAIK